MMDLLLKQDILLHVPFDDISPITQLLQQASRDPQVFSIKITLYRLANPSSIVSALIEAAERGKEVVVVIELRARFDEQPNIDIATALEEAGCQVIYGFDRYKVHSKLCLITAKMDSHIRTFTHIGTGNYNEVTAKQYTDLHYLTSNELIGQQARTFFTNLQMGEIDGFNDALDPLYASPTFFKRHLIESIHQEIRLHELYNQGHIIFKMNSLTDKEIMDALIEANLAGVKVDLIVRGICCIKSQLKGRTENIHVRSIIGRYLEHSRIYYFNHHNQPEILIASADCMTRNTEKRIELALSIKTELIKSRIIELLSDYLRDDIKHFQAKQDDYKWINNSLDVQVYQQQKIMNKPSSLSQNRLDIFKWLSMKRKS
jgi:polyphosphate kinase